MEAVVVCEPPSRDQCAVRGPGTTAALQVNRLLKRYGDKIALDHVSLSVERGEVVGILGPNGAGKTTLIDLVCGLRKPDGGDVSILGRPVCYGDPAVWQHVAIALPAASLPPRQTAAEVIALYRDIYGAAAGVADVVRSVGIEAVAHKRIARLSNGQRQRLTVSLALIARPDLLLLDEPTSELDPHGRRAVWTLIREHCSATGRSVLLATHQMDEAAALCDRIAIIVDGRVAALGTPDRLIETYCPGSTIVVRMRDASFRALDTAVRQEARDGTIRFFTRELLPSLKELMGRSEAEGNPIDALHVDRPTLEDVFFAVAGKSWE